MMRKAKEPSVWKGGFLFVGNHLALDFLNTRPIEVGEPKELLPDFASLLRWFQAAGLISPHCAARLKRKWGQSAEAQRVVEAMRRWRERLREEILRRGSVPARYLMIEQLNRLMAVYPMHVRLKSDGTRLSRELYFKPQSPGDLFAPLAHVAALLFTMPNRDRVRKCDGCVLHFMDTSKKGTRRWCSMQLCGNRLKVAAYAARRRAASGGKTQR
jgi:predicted RNA-binding Zn ribbon-like protein